MSCSNQEEALPRMFTAGLESGGPGPYCYHKSSFSLTPVAAGRNRSMEVESRRTEEATTEAAIETREEKEKREEGEGEEEEEEDNERERQTERRAHVVAWRPRPRELRPPDLSLFIFLSPSISLFLSLSPFADRVHKMLKYSWGRTTRDIPPRMFSFLSLYLFLSPFSFFFDSSSINSNRVRFAPLKYCEKCVFRVFHDVP